MPLKRLPSLSGLRAFEAAARRGSFKEAAAELSVTPAAISQQIKGLEEELQVTLFERKVRAVALTAAGQTLQPHVSEAFLNIRQAVDRVRPTPVNNQLRINSTGPIISKWLLPRLHKFTARAPQIQVHIETERKLNAMEPGGPDIVIRRLPEPPTGLYAEQLHGELLIPVASSVLLDARGITDPRDIDKAPLIADSGAARGGNSGWACWTEAVGLPDQSHRSDIIIFTDYASDQIADAAAAGNGIALGRSLIVYVALTDGRLTAPFGPVIPSGYTYYICCREGREDEPQIVEFFDWAREEAAVLSTLNALRTPA